MTRNLKQNGNALIATIVVLAIIIASAIGFIFWNNFVEKNKPVATTTSPQTTTSSTPKVDTSIHEVNIKIQTTTDISQLPTYTPASFKSYVQQQLGNNTPSQSAPGCMQQYRISKISQVNIQGGVTSVGDQCIGGTPAIWVLTPAGTWDQESLNGPVCKSKNDGLIYEEFESQCYTSTESSSFVKNPNGSITSLNK